MDIYKAGSRPTQSASADYFTGRVTMDPIVSAPEPATVRALSVHFEPGARTAWHTHPLGQTLHVVSGAGYVQKEGEPRQDILPGDTVWIAPHEKHWHGATEETAMTHIAIHEALDGETVVWLEQVTDGEYGAG
ncbi:(R)-mandelonitrile lyase [Hoeflea prorocentri]|uniref:Cupin domain-containing protein n=1 Tax=Hoeflea prorocentri TaxID=1922333 RepID=A0A9X3UIS9_9HYPH|nr:cupin domain-containing protein [Hoeflea prorocentri]MCY6382112.1 cupin domain-containing protein [Hoeflea prorocentri]MDA5399912.1 cupin domain-containing protein [Hoeflea prorocentri]